MEEPVFTHDNLSERVADYIRRGLLYSNRYKKGQHMLENEIAEELQISRAPVREALRELEGQGLLVFVPRKGVFVANFDQEDMLEIYDIRYMLESRVMEILIEQNKLNETDFVNLRGFVNEMVKISENGLKLEEYVASFSENDIAFHRYLWTKANRKWSAKILRNLYYQLRLAIIQDLIIEHDLARSAAMHYEIVDCLEKRDLSGAKEAFVRHIVTLERKKATSQS